MYKETNLVKIGIRPYIAMVWALVFTSCGVSSIVIEGDYPTPNIEQIPIDIAVIYNEALQQSFYIEYSSTDDEEYVISSGQAHIELFRSILPAMFNSVVEVNSVDEAQVHGVDAIFIPNIDEFQLGLPYKTKLGLYEVWIRYNLLLLAQDGSPLADWVLTSYGKTPTETLRGTSTAINEAAVVALRDLASSFSLSFGQVPEVRDWLAARQ
jgi:hypothetical protein